MVKRKPSSASQPGRVALITGASRGIGAAIAGALAELGYSLALVGRDQQELQVKADELLVVTPTVALPGDVTDARAMERAVTETLRRFSRIDLLVNNAGIAHNRDLADYGPDDDSWQDIIEVNLTGLIRLTQLVLPGMLEQRSGVIVNIASTAGHHGHAGLAVYCASKHGVLGFTKALGKELRGTGVSVYAVCPGPVDTKLFHDLFQERARRKPESIAQVVADLATGEMQLVNGGDVDLR